MDLFNFFQLSKLYKTSKTHTHMRGKYALTLWYSSCMTELKSLSQVLQSQCLYLTMWASRCTGVGKLRSQTLQVTSSSSGKEMFVLPRDKKVLDRPLIYLFKYKGEWRRLPGEFKRNFSYDFLIAQMELSERNAQSFHFYGCIGQS